ncbi:kinase-like protein [Neoconidiobolus thromboides FSU 785]|nr:kinase-like protein [Neoconidiobolus thromboides FSU 785]
MSGWMYNILQSPSRIFKGKGLKEKTVPELSQDPNSQSISIGGPTNFEHGIHIEYNGDSGRFMGVPDVWQSRVPHEDLLNTRYIDPNLVPKIPEVYPRTRENPVSIGTPYGVKHEMSINFSSGTPSAIGIPKDWLEKFAESGISLMPSSYPDKLVDDKGFNFNRTSTRYSTAKATRRVSLNSISSLTKRRSIYQEEVFNQSREPSLLEMALDKAQRESLEIPQPLKALTSYSDRFSTSSPRDSLSSVGPLTPHFVDDYQLRDYVVDVIEPSIKFSEIEAIAEGESGDVHKAIDNKTGKKVAIKIVKKDMKQKLETLKNELFMMKTNNHPNLLFFDGCYINDASLWMVMEYMDMGPLTDIISSYPEIRMNEYQIARVSYDILCALSFLEKLNRIHRDIMSDNILINSNGQIKLADFAKACDFKQGIAEPNESIGVLYWMSPEMIRGDRYNHKTDSWSFGILLLEMAEGGPPLMGLDAVTAKESILSGVPPQLEDPYDWSLEFKQLLYSALVCDPEKRSSASELLENKFLKRRSPALEIVDLYRKSIEYQNTLEDEDEE